MDVIVLLHRGGEGEAFGVDAVDYLRAEGPEKFNGNNNEKRWKKDEIERLG